MEVQKLKFLDQIILLRKMKIAELTFRSYPRPWRGNPETNVSGSERTFSAQVAELKFLDQIILLRKMKIAELILHRFKPHIQSRI
jgi:hypothetical protein